MKYFILTALLLTSCGKDESNDSIPDPSTAPTSVETSNPAQGPAGAKGDKGEKGDKGDAGPAGPAGRDGKDAETLSVNQWVDALTGKTWSILPSQPWTSDACGLYRFPTTAEMQVAISHGIFLASAAIGGEDKEAWTGDADSGGHVAILPGITGADADTESHGVFCVKK